MKIALSYKFTGEDSGKLKNFLDKVHNSLEKAGHKPIGAYAKQKEFEKNKTPLKEIMQIALNCIDNSDIHLVIINSEEKSEGMLIEIGYSYAKDKRIVAAIKRGVKTTWIRELVEEVIEFSDISDLCKQLEKLK